MRTIFFTIAVFIYVIGTAQKPNSNEDCLQPIGSHFGILKAYNEKIRSILFNGLSDFQLAQYRTSGERVWAIEIDTAGLKNEKFTIVYHRSESSIWHSILDKNKREIIVEKFRKDISPEDAWRLAKLYSSALSSVREDNRIGIDGSSYYFSDMTKTGRAWLGGKPIGSNKIERLIILSNNIAELMLSIDKNLKISNELTSEIEILTKEFEIQRNANNR